MVIKSLKLENYRRFTRLFLEFPENLIGIIGNNGTGKSTIIEAIGWVLYGNRLGRSDKQDIRTQNMDEKAPCSVELLFVYGGHEYKIVRKLKGKNATSEAAIYMDAGTEPEAVQDRGVNAFIENLLQLDYTSFTTSVFAQQKDLAKLSSLEPEERRQSINRLIGIDKIDAARTLLRKDRNDKQQYLNGIQASLKDMQVLTAFHKTLSGQIKEKSVIIDDLNDQIVLQAKEVSLAKTNLSTQTEKRDQYIKFEGKLGKLRSRLDENTKNLTRASKEMEEAENASILLSGLQKDLITFDTVKAEKEKLDENAARANTFKARSEEKSRLIHQIEKESAHANEFKDTAELLNRYEKELDSITLAEKQHDTDIKETRQKLTEIQGHMKALENEGTKENKRLAQVTKIGMDGECPLCTQKLGVHYSRVTDDLTALIEHLRADYKELKKTEIRLLTDLERLETKLRAIRKDREQLVKNTGKAQEALKSLQRINESLTNFNKQAELLQKEIDTLGVVTYSSEQHLRIKQEYEQLLSKRQQAAGLEERAKRKENIRQDITMYSGIIQETETEITEILQTQSILNYNEHDYKSAGEKVEQTFGKLETLKEQLGVIREKIAALNQEYENNQREIFAQEKIRADMADIKEEIIYLNALDDQFGAFRLELAGRIRPLIARRASELLALTTLSRYSILELDKDYNIQIYDGNQAFLIQRFSGGEQDLANLCLRIAISQIVAERGGGAPVNFIVLDEIFGSQDTERRDLILNALAQLTTQFRQIFIITHIDTIKDMLPVIIEVKFANEHSTALLI